MSRRPRGRGRGRVEFLDQKTLPGTRSDHRPLLVLVRIWWRGRSIDVVVVTWNIGKGTEDDLERVIAAAQAFWIRHDDARDRVARKASQGQPLVVVCLQEAGGDTQSDRIHRVAHGFGYEVLDGDGRLGQSSTPILTSPALRVKAKLAQSLLAATNIGPGAGPSRNKPKWWLGGRLAARGVRFNAASIHVVPTQGLARRLWAALQQGQKVLRIVRNRRIPTVTAGDLNATPAARLWGFLRRAGFTSNHHELGTVPTHGPTRAIDAVIALAHPRKKENR